MSAEPPAEYDKLLDDALKAEIHGGLEDAIRLYSAIIDAPPASPGVRILALAYRGRTFWKKGDYDRAIEDCNEAIASSPEFADAFNIRGNAYRETGQYRRAVSDYDVAIHLQPDFAEAFANRGNAHEDEGRYGDAIADYEKAIALKPDYYQTFNSIGNARRYKARLDYRAQQDLALADYDTAIRMNPGYDEAFGNRGVAKLYGQAPASALQDLVAAVRAAPTDPYNVIWLHLARARLGQDDRDEINVNASRVSLDEWPGQVVALFQGKVSCEHVRAAAAGGNDYVRQGRECEANFYVGELQLQRGALDEAHRLFELAVNGCPKGFVEYDCACAELARSSLLIEYMKQSAFRTLRSRFVRWCARFYSRRPS